MPRAYSHTVDFYMKYFLTLFIGATLALGVYMVTVIVLEDTNQKTVVINVAAKEIMETATTERDLQVKYLYETTWEGSVKSIRLAGEFTAKAGYDHNSFEIKSRIMVLGSPSLISCELKHLHQLEEENGLWNKLQDSDRRVCFNRLHELARKQALNQDMVVTPEKSAKKIVASQTTYAPLF